MSGDPTPLLEAALPERERPEFVDLACASPAKAARTSALIHLHVAGRALAYLRDALRSDPGSDLVADEAIRILNEELDGAGLQLERFRALRERGGSA